MKKSDNKGIIPCNWIEFKDLIFSHKRFFSSFNKDSFVVKLLSLIIGEIKGIFPCFWILKYEFDSIFKLDEFVLTWNNDILSSIDSEL